MLLYLFNEVSQIYNFFLIAKGNNPPVFRLSLSPMEVEKLAKKLRESLPFEANQDQVQALDGLAGFALDLEPRQAFLLQGHAGTGKTSLMKALVKNPTSI